jgi:uncharacterized protein (DUF433 family)
MQLEDDFDFLAPADIRIKGRRVGIETVLNDYLDLGLFPEAIALRYPTLDLEAVYATITYYRHNKVRVDAYLRSWREHGELMRREQAANPPPALKRLHALIRERDADSYSVTPSES